MVLDQAVSAPDETLKADRRIAEKMPRAWSAFFGTFGRLTPAQRAAMPAILDGHDVLVTSATASGKTEAACAPLVERYLDRPSPWMILYVSPTRALANDLLSRLESPLRTLRLRVARRTGDHKEGEGSDAHVLLTTPESFDSLLCRGRRDTGHILAGVAAVVIDEAHLLYGTPRGEQIRWLLARLRRLRQQAVREGWTTNAAVQVIALSATLQDPVAVKSALLPDGKIVTVPGSREIEVIPPPGTGVTRRTEDVLPLYLASDREATKILLFSNSRKRVDTLALLLRDRLAPLRYEVVAHHGSLSKKKREGAEELARTRERIVICATSTLELGIDIGDIDTVVLDGPPPNIPSLLQRIGRGNRRTGKTRVLPCWQSTAERVVQESMLSAAAKGDLGPIEVGPSHAVIRQQIASYIYQAPRRYRSESQLLSLAAECAPVEIASEVLRHMISSGELKFENERISLGQDWLDQAAGGAIHSTIESTYGATVVDAATGDRLAEGIRLNSDGQLRIGGHNYRVLGGNVWRIEVEASRRPDVEATWRYASSGPRFVGAGQPYAVRRHLGIADHVWPIVRVEGRDHVFHFGGARRRVLLTLLASDLDVLDITEWAIIFAGDAPDQPPDWLLRAAEAPLVRAARDSLESIERMLARPRANAYLPERVRHDEIVRWLGIPGELQAMKAAIWQRSEGVTASVLREFVTAPPPG